MIGNSGTAAMETLVSTHWLRDNCTAHDLVILDATRHLPQANRDAREEFLAEHIAHALFLDLESLTDKASAVPAAIPSARQLSARLGDLGMTPDTRIVLYDDSAVRSSARAWFILTSYGLRHVAILDGGFAKWRADALTTSTGIARRPDEPAMTLQPATGVKTKAELLGNFDEPTFQIIDARNADRVFGTGDDPVHGGKTGRIPGSLNVPFGQLFNSDGTYKSRENLQSVFEGANVDLDRPIVTTCGSGITASVLTFALHLIGKANVKLYDGSWLEWGSDPDTPKAHGPQEDCPQ